jgi:hypothetical protein
LYGGRRIVIDSRSSGDRTGGQMPVMKAASRYRCKSYAQ